MRNVFNGSLYIATMRRLLASTVSGHTTDRNIPETKNAVPRPACPVSVELVVVFIFVSLITGPFFDIVLLKCYVISPLNWFVSAHPLRLI